MSGVLVDDACVTIDLLGRDMDRDALIAHREHADRIRKALAIFAAAIAGA
jgi:hypothetical protein